MTTLGYTNVLPVNPLNQLNPFNPLNPLNLLDPLHRLNPLNKLNPRPPLAQKAAPVKPRPPAPPIQDTVQISPAAQAAAQALLLSTETHAQLLLQALRGNLQAQQLVAREAATAAQAALH